MKRQPDGPPRIAADENPIVAFEELRTIVDRPGAMPEWFPKFLDDMRVRRLITADELATLRDGDRGSRVAVQDRARNRYYELVADRIKRGEANPIR